MVAPWQDDEFEWMNSVANVQSNSESTHSTCLVLLEQHPCHRCHLFSEVVAKMFHTLLKRMH